MFVNNDFYKRILNSAAGARQCYYCLSQAKLEEIIQLEADGQQNRCLQKKPELSDSRSYGQVCHEQALYYTSLSRSFIVLDIAAATCDKAGVRIVHKS